MVSRATVALMASKTVRIPTTVYERAIEVADDRDMSLKEAIRHMTREGGYDV